MYLAYFLVSLTLAVLLTPLVRILMRHFMIEDEPRDEKRKIHKEKVPLGGGLAIFLSFFLVLLVIFLTTDHIGQNIAPKHLLGLFLGGLVLMIVGVLDDKYSLRAKQQIWFPIVAALIVIVFGIGPDTITNPFGGVFRLDSVNFGNWVVLADVVVFFWLMGMMFTTKLLDGLDGLVAGIVSIGALMIAFLSLQSQWFQPDVALVSIVFAGCCLGFLFWNWHPAKIFLGEGGSLFAGFVLGSLAVISGSKIATTLLVMGIPILDVARVIVLRVYKKKPVYVGDAEHLHFRLLQSGLTQQQAVLLLYGISFLFGITTLFLQSSEKLIALLFLFVLMLLVGIGFSRKKDK